MRLFGCQPQPLFIWARYTSDMKVTRILFILLLGTVCAACGNKGPLVRPDKSADAPAETAPEKQNPEPSAGQ
jgi:predicted small lipoprotein YifL